MNPATAADPQAVGTRGDRVPFLDLAAATAELGAEIEAALIRVARSGWYVGGPETEAFERDFADWCGAGHCVGTGNGLDALTLCLRALDIGPGDEVIVPSNTYIATWLAVSATGATPVPAEPDPTTRNLDPAAAEAAGTARTRAILPVHLYGLPADLDALGELASARGWRLVEDAAQAHGARLRGRRIGDGGSDAACWSFYPGKNLGALGDAGAVTTDDPELAARIRRLGNYGSPRKYVHEERGANSRLDPMQAAALRVKLPHLDAWNDRRRAIAARYLEGLSGLERLGLTLPPAAEGTTPAWHLFVIGCPRRDAVQAALSQAGVDTLIHYPIPPHMQAAYAELGLAPEALPVARRLAEESLSLPMGPHLSDAQADRVVAALHDALGAALGAD